MVAIFRHPLDESVVQLFPVSNSIKVFPVVMDDGEEVSVTAILTELERVGTVNLYHTSRREPQLSVPITDAVVEAYKVPAVGEQVGPTGNAIAELHALLTGWENDKYEQNNRTKRVNGFFIRWTFTIRIRDLPQDISPPLIKQS